MVIFSALSNSNWNAKRTEGVLVLNEWHWHGLGFECASQKVKYLLQFERVYQSLFPDCVLAEIPSLQAVLGIRFHGIWDIQWGFLPLCCTESVRADPNPAMMGFCCLFVVCSACLMASVERKKNTVEQNVSAKPMSWVETGFLWS